MPPTAVLCVCVRACVRACVFLFQFIVLGFQFTHHCSHPVCVSVSVCLSASLSVHCPLFQAHSSARMTAKRMVHNNVRIAGTQYSSRCGSGPFIFHPRPSDRAYSLWAKPRVFRSVCANGLVVNESQVSGRLTAVPSRGKEYKSVRTNS